MSWESVWPFRFELNILQRRARRERTVFVELDVDGRSRWEDFAGRMTRIGGVGGFSSSPDGGIKHHRGDHEISEAAEAKEQEDFTLDHLLAPEEFQPIKDMIERVGKLWMSGWELSESQALHDLLETVYWKHINRFMHEPFDPEDA